MRIVAAGRALWNGIVAPTRVQDATTQTAAAIFAVAVLLVGAMSTWSALTEGSDPRLVEESRVLSQSRLMAPASKGDVDLALPQRHFTAALGGALMVTIFTIAGLAGLFLFLMRFLTNAPATYSQAIVAVSATGLIICLDLFVTTIVHVLFHTSQAGLHAGVFVSPLDSPMVFTWLQLCSVFSLWQYLAIAVALSAWNGLHRNYGYVIGTLVWFITRLILGGLTFVGWIVSPV